MKTRYVSFFCRRSTVLVGLSLALCAGLPAADQTIAGNLTVTGAITELQGNTLKLGTQGTGAGSSVTYADANVDTLTFFLNRNPSSFLWAHSATINAMRLTSAHDLVLYKADGTTAGLTFAPDTNTISLGTTTLYRDSTSGALRTNGALTVDGAATVTGTLTATGAFTAPNFTSSTGSLTGGASGLTLNAGGTNQNITLKPSGSGTVGIGTNAQGYPAVTIGGSDSIMSLNNTFSTGLSEMYGLNTFVSVPPPESGSSLIRQLTGHSIRASATADQSIIWGTRVFADTSRTGNVGTIVGAESTGSVYHTGLASNVYGSVAIASNTSSNPVTEMVAGKYQTINSGPGSTAKLGGIEVTIANAGAPRGTPSASVSDVKGLSFTLQDNTGTLTNTYGVYVGDITTGTQTNKPYSFYAADVGADNYFAGRVGVGNTAPAEMLDVTGNAKVSGKLTAGSGRFDGPVRIAPQGDLSMGSFTAEP